MAFTQEFIDAVDSGKILRVRIMLKDIMLVDPTMKQFNEMQDYALHKMEKLYDEHDEEELKYDSAFWSEDYLNLQMVAVVSNFSQERVDLLKNMVKHIYKDRVDSIKDERKEISSSTLTRRKIGTGVAISGVAITVAGICVSESLIIAGGVVTVAVGVAMVICDKEK